jgi:hypothetical protein
MNSVVISQRMIDVTVRRLPDWAMHVQQFWITMAILPACNHFK